MSKDSGTTIVIAIEGAELTVIVTSLALDKDPSEAVSRKVYVPLAVAEKLTVVFSKAAFAKVTVPLPLTCDQVVVNVPVRGKPSSVAWPLSFALEGKVIVWFDPAFTVGA